MKEIAQVAEELSRLGASLQELAKALSAEPSINKEAPAPEKKKEEPALTLVDVRKVLTAKSRDGKTAEVKALLKSHGAEKLSEVKPSDYAALIKEAEAL